MSTTEPTRYASIVSRSRARSLINNGTAVYAVLERKAGRYALFTDDADARRFHAAYGDGKILDWETGEYADI